MPLTREQWDSVCKARISAMLFGGRVKPEVAIRHANETMTQDYGPRPEKEIGPEEIQPKPPWWARLALRVTVGKGDKGMAKVLPIILRFGPLVAAAALGLAAVLEPILPGYTGIVTQVLNFLGVVGVTADPEVVQTIATFVAGITALVGVVRKSWSLIQKKYATPKP